MATSISEILADENLQFFLIYGLIDPDNGQLRYVGQTRQTLRKRLCSHLHLKDQTWRHFWIEGLLAEGKIPEIVEIELVPREQADEAERFWIAYYRFLGCTLTNLAPGGQDIPRTPEVIAKWRASVVGRKNGPLSLEVRRKISEAFKRRVPSPESLAKHEVAEARRLAAIRGRPLSTEHKAKLSEIFKGRIFTPEWKKNISISRRGKAMNPVSTAKMAATKKGRKHGPLSQSTRTKISLALKGRKLPEELREKLSQAHRRQIPWNKGIRGEKRGPLPQETKDKISTSNMGRTYSPETIQKMSLSHLSHIPWNKGIKWKRKKHREAEPFHVDQ